MGIIKKYFQFLLRYQFFFAFAPCKGKESPEITEEPSESTAETYAEEITTAPAETAEAVTEPITEAETEKETTLTEPATKKAVTTTTKKENNRSHKESGYSEAL